MHELRKPQYCIDWTCAAAKIAADTQGLINSRDPIEARMAEFRWYRLRFCTEQLGELSDGRHSPRRAKIDCGCAVDERLRVRAAARIAALPALNPR